MVERKRWTNELEQQKVSFGQIQICFKGWKIDRIENDVGEDLLVHVFDDGVSAKLDFFVQCKSCATFDTYRLATDKAALSYPLLVKDLEHWEGRGVPVVILIWDVHKQRGHWVSVKTAVASLDAQREGWRTQDSVSVRVPVANTTTDRGRRALRQTIASELLPMLGHGKKLTIRPTFKFPATKAGARELEKLRRSIEEGDEVEISGKYISNFETSDWWQRSFGKTKVASLRMGSAPGKREIPFVLEATSPSRTSMLLIPVRFLKGGTKRTVLESDAAKGPHRLSLTLHSAPTPGRLEVSFRITFPSPSPHDSLATCRFLRAATESGRISMVLPTGSRYAVEVGDRPSAWSTGELEAWEQFLQKVVFVESHTRKFGTFKIPELPSKSDLADIEQLSDLCLTGEFKSRMTLSMQLEEKQSGGHQEGSTLELSVTGLEFLALGVTIPVGRALYICEDTKLVGEALRAVEASTEENPTLSIKDCPVRVVCPDWPRTAPSAPAAAKL